MPLRRHPRVVLGALALSVLAVVVGALGGFARNAPDDVRTVQPGVEVDVTPFRFSIDSAQASYELHGRVADEGLAYVLVEGVLSLEDDESVSSTVLRETVVSDLEGTYSVSGSPQKEARVVNIQVAEDGSTLLGIGPGLTYRVRLVFQLDESAVPDRVTVVLREHFERASSLDQVVGWYLDDQSVHVTVDVAPLPDVRPPPEDFL